MDSSWESNESEMDLQELKYFLLVMECGSFSKAAEKGFTTQPNISKHIAALESSLNTTLFERRSNGVIPTADAIAISKRLPFLIEQMEQLLAEPASIASTDYETLHIGFTENMDIDTVAAPFFLALKSSESARLIPIKLQSYPLDDIVPNIENGNIDLGFVYSVLSVDPSLFNRIAVTRGNPRLYYSLKHPLATKEGLTVSDFKDAVFVTHSFKSDQNYVRFNGLPFEPEHMIFADSLTEVSLYVNSGMAVTVLGPSQTFSSNPGICFIELESATSKIGTDAIWLNHNKKDALRAVIPCLLQS